MKALMRSCAVSLLGLGLGLAASAAEPAPATIRLERLAVLADVWGQVKYLHPALVRSDLDWDAPLLAAIPEVEKAQAPAEFHAAVSRMLSALKDPGTYVHHGEPPTPLPRARRPGPDAKPFRWIGKDTVVVSLRDLGWNGTSPAEQIDAQLGPARAVIIDLRRVDAWDTLDASRLIAATTELTPPTTRVRLTSGFPTQGDFGSGYPTGTFTEAIKPVPPAADQRARRFVFIAEENGYIPARAFALQRAGVAKVVVEGKLTAHSLYTQGEVPLGDGATAFIRHTDLVIPEGVFEPRADREVPVEDPPLMEGKVVAAALEVLKGRWRKPVDAAGGSLALPVVRPENRYPELKPPGREHRLLALFRVWNAIERFYPYRPLIEKEWAQVLVDFIPRFEAAKTLEDYELTLWELGRRIPDGHTRIFPNPAYQALIGAAAPPFVLRRVEEQPVVVELLDEELARKACVAVGDVLVSVDGQTVEERVAVRRRYVPGSTDYAQLREITRGLAHGADASTARLVLRRGKELHEVSVGRSKQFLRAAPATKVPYRVLDSGFGYADLRLLEKQDVDAMFEAFKDTKGIIFDLRGYPRSTAWVIAPRLNTRGAKHTAQFQRMHVQGGTGEAQNGRYQMEQAMPRATGRLYTKPTVALIDERAISQAEHTCLFLEVANGTTFVGTPTAGANGDVTLVALPGGYSLMFGAHDVRHADGRQLQRVGILPDVEAKATVAGLRAGRDEVLEAGIRHLAERITAGARR